MRIHTLTTDLWLPRPIEEVFSFFGDVYNLDRLTPPWLHFQILTPKPIALAVGARIDYRLRLHGLPIRWQTLIDAWEPPRRFVDTQVSGPYRQWIHEHRFESVNGGTQITDYVRYAVPGWILEPVVHALLVGPDVRRIFEYRKQELQKLFA